MSVRGVISGVAGSAAVAAVAVFGLGMADASADAKHASAPAQAEVTLPMLPAPGFTGRPTGKAALIQLVWLRRLLQPGDQGDPPAAGAPIAGRRRHG